MHPTNLATWPRRYSYNEWRRFPQNQALNEHEARELYKREALKYSLIEEELLRLNGERQANITNTFNGLQYAISNVFNVSSIINTIGNGRGEYLSLFKKAVYSTPEELVTDQLNPDTGEPFLLFTEDLEQLITDP